MAFNAGIASLGLASPYEDTIRVMAQGEAGFYALVKGVISQESQWNPSAVNPNDPSYGLMQVMIPTARIYDPTASRDALLDGDYNIQVGASHLRSLLSRWSESDAVAAYNAGVPRKNSAGQYTNSVGDTKVQVYVDSVLTYASWFMNRLPASLAPSTASPPSTSWWDEWFGAPTPTPSDTPPVEAPGSWESEIVLGGAGAGLLLLAAGVVWAMRD